MHLRFMTWANTILRPARPAFWPAIAWLAMFPAAGVHAQLSAADEPATAPPTAIYRIRGTVGSQQVDLLVTPVTGPPAILQPAAAAQPPAAGAGGGDPARLARIRSAKAPKISRPVMFDTPEADAVVSALEIFPPDNPWNVLVSDWPLHPDSRKIVATIGAEKPLRCNPDMAFILVPPDQPRVDVKIIAYPGESDPGPFPLPDNTPIEGWPAYYERSGKKLSLDDVQRDRPNAGGDRHASVVDPANHLLYEFYQLKKTDQGWTAACTAIFDLKSNRLRPDGWTSTDAAGLPIFPAVVRYDELKRGTIDHALRVTVERSRKSYVYPATHRAGHGTDASLPRMGERLRLRQDFDTSRFSPEVRVILTALKRYGMLVADNGLAWSLSMTPDPRIGVLHEELRKVKGSDFEVVEAPPGYQRPK